MREWEWACRMCVAVCDGVSFSFLFLSSPCFFKRADLEEGVTDSGLRALASAGCGENLTSLTLFSECCCVPVCELMFCESGSGSVGSVGCVLLSVTGALSPPVLSSCLLAFANAEVWKPE